MSNNFGTTALIPGLVNEVALEIFLHFVAIDRDGPFTLVLVCTAWRDMVLRSKSLKRLRRDRRRPNRGLMENRENAEEGICIVSFDGGGPGSMSQLRILDEVMIRMAFSSDTEADELLPADYFDLMGGVGFGGLVAILLGRLRMTTKQAMEELSEIGADTFPKGEEMVTTEVTMAKLRNALESLLNRHGHSTEMKLRDSSGNRCKVVLFAATTTVIDHCHPFRTYRSPRKCLECTLVDAACATMATPEHFSSVGIGPRLRKQSFAGIPHGFDNPMREVIKEAQLVFGEKKPVSLALSLGSGQRARLSDPDRHITRRSRVHCDGVARDLQHQLRGFGEYLRLNVDKGMETMELDDWHDLGSIESYTDVYLEMNQITRYIDRAVQWLLQRNGSVTLGQMSGISTDCVAMFHSETLKNYLTMEFKQMHDVVQQLGIEKITLVDAIGNNIPVPLEFCLTYNMLSDVISLYFRHQKAPGSDFVDRGDYRLVNGNRRNTVGPTEWNQIEKVGLKVEMSMILRTRNEDKPKCPGCRTLFEGSATDEWAQCLSCLRQFQVETQVEARAYVQSDDAPQSDLTESSVMPLVVRESKSGKPLVTISGETETLRFRLFSVINICEVNATPNEPSLLILGHGAIPPVTTTEVAMAEDQLYVSEPAAEPSHSTTGLSLSEEEEGSEESDINASTNPNPTPNTPGGPRLPSSSQSNSSSRVNTAQAPIALPPTLPGVTSGAVNGVQGMMGQRQLDFMWMNRRENHIQAMGRDFGSNGSPQTTMNSEDGVPQQQNQNPPAQQGQNQNINPNRIVPTDSNARQPSPRKKRIAPKQCTSCNSKETPEWRRGPNGPRSLCDPCGLHWAKLQKKRKEDGQWIGQGVAPPIDIITLRQVTGVGLQPSFNNRGELEILGDNANIPVNRTLRYEDPSIAAQISGPSIAPRPVPPSILPQLMAMIQNPQMHTSVQLLHSQIPGFRTMPGEQQAGVLWAFQLNQMRQQQEMQQRQMQQNMQGQGGGQQMPGQLQGQLQMQQQGGMQNGYPQNAAMGMGGMRPNSAGSMQPPPSSYSIQQRRPLNLMQQQQQAAMGRGPATGMEVGDYPGGAMNPGMGMGMNAGGHAQMPSNPTMGPTHVPGSISPPQSTYPQGMNNGINQYQPGAVHPMNLSYPAQPRKQQYGMHH